MDIEIWKDIDEFKGLYQVSNMGRVRSVERHIYTRTYPSIIMSQSIKYNNKKQPVGNVVRLRNQSSQISRSVGRLVALSFLGKPPKNAKQIRHKDKNPLNNTLTNIEWDVNKSYGMPENHKAREFYEKYAYSFIKSWLREYAYLQISYLDKEDIIQECAIAIWNVIDLYDDTHCSFKRFVYIKCDFVFKKLYFKYSRRKEIAPYVLIENQMVTEKKPIDSQINLSYVEDYDTYE